MLFVRLSIKQSQAQAQESKLVHRAITSLFENARNYPLTLKPVARQARRVGRLDEALAIAESIWQNREAASSEDLLGCAMLWYDNQRLRRGDAALELAKSLDPSLIPLHEEEALNQRWRGNLSAAQGATETLLSLSSDQSHRAVWRSFLGELKYELRDYVDAADLLTDDLNNSDVAYKRGVSLERIGQFSEANEVFAKLEDPSDSEDPHVRRGLLHYRHGTDDLALKSLTLAASSIESNIALNKLQILLGYPERVNSGGSDSGASDQALELRGLAFELSGSPAKALGEYKRILQRRDAGSLSTELRKRIARAATQAQDFELAAKLEYQDAPRTIPVGLLEEEADPGYRDLALRINLALDSDDVPEAIELLRKITLSTSTRANSRLLQPLLGRCLTDMGSSREAALAFLKVNDFRLPHAKECADEVSPLSMSEYYTELTQVFPLSPDVILYETHHGANTSCNPLAICLELLSSGKYEGFTHVWVLKRGAVIHPDLQNKPNVHFVFRESWGYYLHLATAKYLVNNTTFPPEFFRREGQSYLNTWHGTPWKHLGSDIKDDPFGHANAGRNFMHSTSLALPNAHTSDIISNAHEIGHLLRKSPDVIGSPRVDLTLRLSDARRSEILKQLDFSEDRPVIFYAPTWRGNLGNTTVDASEFIAAANELAETNANVLVRFHPLLTKSIPASALSESIVVVPETIDTNEVLAITDLLVSDFSSLIFDFAPRNKPVIKHMFDLEEYTAHRGLYFTVDQVPGDNSRSVSELGHQVRTILQESLFERDWTTLELSHLWECEDGHATERAIKLLFSSNNHPENVTNPAFSENMTLISLSGLRANGITRSLENLLASYAGGDNKFQLLIPKSSLDTEQARELASRLHNFGDITPFTGLLTGTRQERLAWAQLQRSHTSISPLLKGSIQSRMARERYRYFADYVYKSAFDFDGYVAAQAAFISTGFPTTTTTTYVAHSEFYAEMTTRFPRHRQIGQLLDQFTHIASVSDGAMKRNEVDLSREFNVPVEKHSVLPNTIDIPGIQKSSQASLTPTIANWLATPGFNVAIAARLSVEKNHHSLIRALAELHQSGEQIKLLILGGGPEQDRLERLATDLEVSHLIHFSGHQQNPYPAMAASDAVILPSTHEGQGLVLLEAMLLGIPVAASNVTGPASVLNDGEYGLLVDPTVEGLKKALLALSRNEVPVSKFDFNGYQANAIAAFEALL